MNQNLSLSERFSYYQIHQAQQQVLSQLSDFFLKRLPDILAEFDQFLAQHPLSQTDPTDKSCHYLSKGLKQHWQHLLSSDFSEEALQESVKAGRYYQEKNVSPFEFMGAYAFILNKLLDALRCHYRFSPRKARLYTQVLNSILFRNLNILQTSYQDALSMENAEATTTKFADKLLDGNVDLSMAINQVAIENVHMMHSLKTVSQQAGSISSAVQQMASGISNIRQKSADVAENAQSVDQDTHTGKQIIQETASKMQLVSQAVQQASEKVQSLVNSSEKIVDMVQTIDNIAEQTNLLALNATIEAARAGEAGKGFAVVAGEVKNLSSQTARATEDIQHNIDRLMGEINDIVAAMSEGAQAVTEGESSMHQAVASMENIATAIDQTAHHMTDISNILGEEKTSTREISQRIAEIAETASDNVNAIEQSITATDRVVCLITDQIEALSEFDVPNKAVRIAKSDHLLWKKKLSDMMAGRNSLSDTELTHHTECNLGKWYLDVQQHNPDIAQSPAFKALDAPHKKLHDAGITAAEKYRAGHVEEALKLLEDVDQASQEVISLLGELMAY